MRPLCCRRASKHLRQAEGTAGVATTTAGDQQVRSKFHKGFRPEVGRKLQLRNHSQRVVEPSARAGNLS